MKERPILFSAPMVRAILARAKTQTRRVVKPQPIMRDGEPLWPNDAKKPRGRGFEDCPYGRPGDRLWVREAHSIGPGPGVPLQPGETAGALRWPHVTYLADGAVERRDMRWKGAFGVGRPSIHMFRWASRITLEVTDVRVERLQHISADDAKAEGISEFIGGWWCEHDDAEQVAGMTPQEGYRQLWERINGPESWAANPWVWVVEFKRVEELRAAA